MAIGFPILDPAPFQGALRPLLGTPFEEVLESVWLPGGLGLPDSREACWAAGLWMGLRTGLLDVSPARVPALVRDLPADAARVAVATGYLLRNHGQKVSPSAWWTVLHRLDQADGWAQAIEQVREGPERDLPDDPLARAMGRVGRRLSGLPTSNTDEDAQDSSMCVSAALEGVHLGSSIQPPHPWDGRLSDLIEAVARDLAHRNGQLRGDDREAEARVVLPDVSLGEPWYMLVSVVGGRALWMRGDRVEGLVCWVSGQDVEVPPQAFEELRNRFAGKSRVALGADRTAVDSSSLGGFLRRFIGFNAALWVAARLVADGWFKVQCEPSGIWLIPAESMGAPTGVVSKV